MGMDGWGCSLRSANILFRNILNRVIPLFDSKRSLTDEILIVHCKNTCLLFSLFTCSLSSSLQDVEDKMPSNGLNSASWNQK